MLHGKGTPLPFSPASPAVASHGRPPTRTGQPGAAAAAGTGLTPRAAGPRPINHESDAAAPDRLRQLLTASPRHAPATEHHAHHSARPGPGAVAAPASAPKHPSHTRPLSGHEQARTPGPHDSPAAQGLQNGGMRRSASGDGDMLAGLEHQLERKATAAGLRPDSPLELQLRQQLTGVASKGCLVLSEDGKVQQQQQQHDGGKVSGKQQQKQQQEHELQPVQLSSPQLELAHALTPVPLLDPGEDPKARDAGPGGRDGEGEQKPRRMDTSATGTTLNHEGTYDYDDAEMAEFSPLRRFVARICANPDFELIVVLLIFGELGPA